MSSSIRLAAALGILVMLLSMVGCTRKIADNGARPPEVIVPPQTTPVVKVVDVTRGERVSISRAQAATLKLHGAPLSLHQNILDINWTDAVIDYPLIYLYNWEQGQSELLDIQSGRYLASGTRLASALRDKWGGITANKLGTFTDHKFGLALWGEHQYATAGVTVYRDGLPQGDSVTQFGTRWQGFVLTTAPDAPAITVVGFITDAGEVSFFRAHQGRHASLAWSRRGNYVAVTAKGESGATVIYVYQRGVVDPLFTVTPREVQQSLQGTKDLVISPHSEIWASDERILHFTAAPALQPHGSRRFSIWRDGTGLEVMPPIPFDDNIRRDEDAAMKAYRLTVEQRSLSRAAELPLCVTLDVTRTRQALRQNALELLQEKHLLDIGGLFLVLDPTEPVVLPRTLRVWHATNHYHGRILAVLDAKGRPLAEYWLWEHDHYNVILQPTLLDFSSTLPTSGHGYIVALSWNAKDGTMPLEDGIRIPVRFR